MEVVYSICNAGTDLDWSGFCSSLDLLIREEARLQNPLLHRCRNVPLAAKIKCFVLIWRLVVEVMTVHPNQAAWLGIRSSNYENPTPFLMCGALTMGFFFSFIPNHGEWDIKNIIMTVKKSCSVAVMTLIVIMFCLCGCFCIPCSVLAPVLNLLN